MTEISGTERIGPCASFLAFYAKPLPITLHFTLLFKMIYGNLEKSFIPTKLLVKSNHQHSPIAASN